MFAASSRALKTVCAAAALVAVPSQSHACWLTNCFAPRTTYYAPVAVAPAPVCNPCQQQTVSYAPQTCFRPVTTSVPVTTLQPVAACNPCGGMTTVLKPVTTMVQQTSMMPYTTFRPVVTTSFMPVVPASPCAASPCAASPCATGGCATAAAPAATTTYYSPAAPVMAAPPVAAPTPGCCGTGVSYSPSNQNSTYANASKYAPANPVATGAVAAAPATTAAPIVSNVQPAKAMQDLAPINAAPALKPIPMPESAVEQPPVNSNPTDSLKLVDPQNRTASNTNRSAAFHTGEYRTARPVSLNLGNDGWTSGDR